MRTLRGKRYDVDGTVTAVVIHYETTLRELQTAVGGYIEIVHPRGLLEGREVVLVIDEDGHRKGLARNDLGCELYMTPEHGHPVLGPMVVFDREAFTAFDRGEG